MDSQFEQLKHFEKQSTRRVVAIEYTDTAGVTHLIRSVKATLDYEIYYLQEGGCIQLRNESRRFIAASGETYAIRDVSRETDTDGNDKYTFDLFYADKVAIEVTYAEVVQGIKAKRLYPDAPKFI